MGNEGSAQAIQQLIGAPTGMDYSSANKMVAISSSQSVLQERRAPGSLAWRAEHSKIKKPR
jgi:hypothetical protein